jgi:hypothetical protein
MRVLNARPKLKPGETIRWKALANRIISSRNTSGGQLVVTDHRMFFQPNRFDAAIGRKPWDCPLDSVKGIETIDRDQSVLAGGMRKRLGIQTTDGVETFVVNDLEIKVSELRELLPRA